jgi:AcrR family transcriptional regulator
MANRRKTSARTKLPRRKAGRPAVASIKIKSGKSTRETRTTERREAILTAALAEFSQRGFEATRLDDVARRAKIAKGTIYLYFRDKESLFQELIRDMLVPIIGTIQTLGAIEAPLAVLADRLVDMFVREVYETPRREIVRLMITEGRRFPKVAEFYYREVLSHIIAAVRAILRRAAARGEVSAALVDFPQILVAPGLVAIIWSGLFERFEPLDVRAMMKTHIELLLSPRKTS